MVIPMIIGVSVIAMRKISGKMSDIIKIINKRDGPFVEDFIGDIC